MHRGTYLARAGEHKAMRFKTAKPAAERRDARPRRVVKGRCASAAKARHATPGNGATSDGDRREAGAVDALTPSPQATTHTPPAQNVDVRSHGLSPTGLSSPYPFRVC